MELASAALAAASAAPVGDAVAVQVLKKARDLQAQSALQLLQAVPAVAANNPPPLGNAVDVRA